jgi:cyclopropane fatty-acyl-phospholipid synthase-like methyltransferase
MAVCNPLGIDIFELVLFLVEFVPYLAAVVVGLVLLVWSSTASKWVKTGAVLLLPAMIVVMIGSTFLCSWEDAYRRGYDLSLPSLRSALESYVTTGEGDVRDILESNRHAPTFGLPETNYIVKDLLKHTIFHLDDHNVENIDEGYNKGNDWFAATLGETMIYTCGIYPTGDETLAEAQIHKLDYVADALELQKGDEVLDIGCGWGYLTKHFTEKYGAKVTGITLSTEQLKFGTELNGDNGAKLLLQDAMKIMERDDLPEGGFDKITSLEMAEHVGIRRYQEFLKLVHTLLKDDGVFYFQVAGLRRSWRYEDLTWGLFMGEHVFPGADASCPLGWVTTQLERAGFEVQRVQNMGSHYSRTLDHWLDNWEAKEAYLVDKYGALAYRRWKVFLAWSVRASRQGSSTLFMLTITKHGQEGRRIKTQAHLSPRKELPSPISES